MVIPSGMFPDSMTIIFVYCIRRPAFVDLSHFLFSVIPWITGQKEYEA